ncbi:MAG: hypothetical protein LUG54_04965 [Clostridiales bacterium]|nr:hypothetical protein [Clostridiales bacterium]
MTERYERMRDTTKDIDLFSEDLDYLSFFSHLQGLFEENHGLIKKLMDDTNSRYVTQRVMEENETKSFELVKTRFDMKPEILHIYFRYYTRGMSGSFLEWFMNLDTVPLEEFVETVKNINMQMREALLQYRKTQPDE